MGNGECQLFQKLQLFFDENWPEFFRQNFLQQAAQLQVLYRLMQKH